MQIISHYPQSRYIAPVRVTDRFCFNEGAFIAEASDFRGDRLMGQLYDDACDVGILLLNPKTNKAVPFVHSRQEFDAEGELVAEHFAVCSEAVRKEPKLKGLRVVIFND